MNPVYNKLIKCYEGCKDKLPFRPKVGLILGSGLGSYGEDIETVSVLDYEELTGFPVSTVPGHAGRFLFGYVGSRRVPVVIMQGRVHYYEGYSIQDVVLPVRLMKLMGIEILFLTNAAGGVNLDFEAGDLMMLTDHISSFVPSPLIGPNIEELGTRFPDMSEVYDRGLQNILREAAGEVGLTLKEGVYLQFGGPNFETPAEVRMARTLGADAVGMSTTVEAMAARHMGLKVCGISCITNMACGITKKPLSHAEVQETADKREKDIKRLLSAAVNRMAEV